MVGLNLGRLADAPLPLLCTHTLQLTSFQSFLPPKSPKMGDFEHQRLDFGFVPRMR
jgi:hypothetical protein